MVPIGKDTEFVFIKDHISIDLLESIQGLFGDSVTMSAMKSCIKLHQICCPPSFVFNLAGFNSKQTSSDWYTYDNFWVQLCGAHNP